ncbi:hypothetical protein I7I48_01270 [Histoplasma ohiense]|nr:hypothetical protein I7I48_01270 [Histoplasma ohiense (nom. inval.)]
MSPIPRQAIRLTQRIRNPTLRSLTLGLIEDASKKPDLAHFPIAILKNPSHTSHTDLKPHATALFATEEQFKNNKALTAHIQMSEVLSDAWDHWLRPRYVQNENCSVYDGIEPLPSGTHEQPLIFRSPIRWQE